MNDIVAPTPPKLYLDAAVVFPEIKHLLISRLLFRQLP